MLVPTDECVRRLVITTICACIFSTLGAGESGLKQGAKNVESTPMSRTRSEELIDEAISSFAHSAIAGLAARIDAVLRVTTAPHQRGRLLLARSIVRRRLSRPPTDIRPDLEEATGLLELSGERVLLTIATTQLSSLYLAIDEVDDSIDHAVRAIVMLDELRVDDIEPPAIAMADLATVFRQLTAFDMALAYAQAALAAYDGSVSDGDGLLYVLTVLECATEEAWNCTADGDCSVVDNLAIARSAAAAIDPTGSRHAQVASAWAAAEIALLEDDLDEAREAVEQVADVRLSTGDFLYPHLSLVSGIVASRDGRFDVALEKLDAAEQLVLNDPGRRHRLLRERLSVHRELGNVELVARDALALADSVEDRQFRFVSALVNQVDSRAVAEQSRFELAEKADALTERTRRDALTGVSSRSWFDTCLAKRTTEADNIALVLMDVDHFKAVNDNHSHVVGDEVLRRVGAVLSACSREEDIVARFGGEEFAIIASEGDLVLAHELGERLRKEVEATPWDEIVDGLSVTISVGISAGPAKRSSEVFRAADDALYEAKHAGRNCVIGRRLGRSTSRSGTE